MNAVLFCPSEMEYEYVRQVADHIGLSSHVCGIGPVQSAHFITQFLERSWVPVVILAGIAGSYSEDLLAREQVFVAESEVLADLGRCSERGFEPLGMEEGQIRRRFPLFHNKERIFHRIRASSVLSFASMATVSCSSGSPERAQAIKKLFRVEIENMEGAAAALVCENYDVRLFEIRSVSNLAGETDMSKWETESSLRLLCHGIKELLDIIVSLEES